MNDEKTPHYLNATANANRATQAWKYASFVLGVIAVAFAYLFATQIRNQPTVLVPYDLATAKGNMVVSVNGELRGTNTEYMANIALSDLGLILNFTPDNVISQHQRFMNRLTEETYGTQRENLLAQAEDYKRRGYTQSFYTSSVKVGKDASFVEVAGTQIRWIGGKDVRTSVTYVLAYKAYKGFFHVSDLRQKTDEKN